MAQAVTTAVNEALIKKVAELAHLELNATEITEYVKSIGDILKHVEQLSTVNVIAADGKPVEPMVYGIDGALRMRPDEVHEFTVDENGKPKILKCAPEVLDDGFKVPPIL